MSVTSPAAPSASTVQTHQREGAQAEHSFHDGDHRRRIGPSDLLHVRGAS